MARSVMLLGLLMASWISVYAKPAPDKVSDPTAVFDVTKHKGIVPGGEDDSDDYGLESLNAAVFMEVWRRACESPKPAKVLIPQGKLMIARVLFSGPCKAPITFEVQGTLLSNPDPSFYSSPEWFVFENIQALMVTGTGIFDASGANQGEAPHCRTDDPTCVPGPTTIKFNNITNGVIEGVQSNHAMGFHVFVSHSISVTVSNMRITSPIDLLNSDGVHVEDSQYIRVLNNNITTGEDCVSIGNGAVNITVAGVTCESGYGISVGNLAKYKVNVQNVMVTNCTLKGTKYGVRIKHWPEVQGSEIAGIIFQNLAMEHVNNPIVIDHDPELNPAPGATAVAKISNIHYKNIWGSSATKQLVNFVCTPLMPCDAVEVSDIYLTVDAQAPANASAGAKCAFAKVNFNGEHNGLAC